jgi:hypothetical protein
MAKTNVFTRAKALRKQHPNKSWQDLVQMAAGNSKSVSSPTKKTNMATAKKRKSTGTKRRRKVSGVTTTTTSKTPRSRRRSVGAIVDTTLAQVALGMAAESFVQNTFIKPITNKLPRNGVIGMLIDPALAVAAYKGSQMFKHPIAKGLMLGVMKTSIDNTVTVLKAKLAPSAPPPTPINVSPGAPNVGATQYVQLPSPNLGEIRNYLGSIPNNIGNMESNLPNMAGVGDYPPQDAPYLPLGYDA